MHGVRMSAADSIHDFLDAMTPHVPRHVYHQRFNDTLQGIGDFWMTSDDWRKGRPAYDCEQELAVFRAVQRACQYQGSPADRWSIVERELTKLADLYGESK
jgi:hypothetical protein